MEDRGDARLFDSFIEKFELVIAVLLGLAAIVGAVAAYQTGIKGGDTQTAFEQGNRTSDLASRLKTEVAAKRAEDQIIVTFAAQAVVSATLSTHGQLSNAEAKKLGTGLVNQLGSPELQIAVKKCEGDDACHGPVGSKYYVVADSTKADALDKKADQLFATATKAGKKGDDYSLVTIFLATSLFLYGVAAVGRGRVVKLGMAGVGGVIFLIALVMLATI
jgi:hypothetical protein